MKICKIRFLGMIINICVHKLRSTTNSLYIRVLKCTIMSTSPEVTPTTSSKRVVMFPVDTSIHSEKAFDWYIMNIHRPGDLVLFVHIIEPAYTSPAFSLTQESSPPEVMSDINRVLEENIFEGKELAQKSMLKAKDMGIPCKGFIHIDNKPGHAIVKSAHDHKAELIIMGNRGSNLIQRTLLGSVSDHVINHAHIPVLLVPPEIKH